MPELTNVEQAILQVFNAVDGGLERADTEAHFGDEAREIAKVCAYLVGNSVRIDIRY